MGISNDDEQSIGDTVAYPAPWRPALLVPFAISRLCAPLPLAAVLLINDPPITPPALLTLFALAVALPGMVVAAARALWRGDWELREHDLVVRRRGETIEIPLDAVAAATFWRLPWPRSGVSLQTRAGRRFHLEDGEARLLDALADDGVAAQADGVMAVYARAMRAAPRRRWYHAFGKFVLFSLLPTAPLFNVHQFIAYGGTFGEYYLLGLRAYLTTFAAHWSTVIILLIGVAALWRLLVELACLAAAALAAERAAAIRAWSERAATFAYYIGVPIALALRFWPW